MNRVASYTTSNMTREVQQKKRTYLYEKDKTKTKVNKMFGRRKTKTELKKTSDLK